MPRKLPVNNHDKDFAEWFIQQIDTTHTKIETEADVLEIIKEYKNFTLQKIERRPEHTFWKTYEPLVGLQVKPGFCHIYGPPDTLKTFVGISIANWFSNHTEMNVVYIDAENKLWKAEQTALSKDIYMVAGRKDTHNLVRKLVDENAFQVIIIDTIVAMSRYEDFLRNVVKAVDTNGLYIILLNQTYARNFDDVPAGNDIIPEFAYATHKIIDLQKDKTTYYISTDTDIHLGFSGNERTYSVGESLWHRGIKQGTITQKEDVWYYKNLAYSGKDAIVTLLREEYKNSVESRT